MKKQYLTPELEVLLLDLADVITASRPGTDVENPLPDDELDGITLNVWD